MLPRPTRGAEQVSRASRARPEQDRSLIVQLLPAPRCRSWDAVAPLAGRQADSASVHRPGSQQKRLPSGGTYRSRKHWAIVSPVPACRLCSQASDCCDVQQDGPHCRPTHTAAAAKQASSEVLVPAQPQTQFQKNLASAVRKKVPPDIPWDCTLPLQAVQGGRLCKRTAAAPPSWCPPAGCWAGSISRLRRRSKVVPPRPWLQQPPCLPVASHLTGMA